MESSALQYTICGHAVVAAISIGLHRTNSSGLGVQSDAMYLSWLWWTVYCLDKQISFRLGKPSFIDDDNITTPIPSMSIPGISLNQTTFVAMIKQAQISSSISRKLVPVFQLQSTLFAILSTVHDFHQQLEQLLQDLPHELRVQPSARIVQVDRSSATHAHKMYLHCTIHGIVMALHAPFFYPWISSRMKTGGIDHHLDAQIQFSSKAIAASAQNIVLAVRHMVVDVATPRWLVFCYPLFAHMNLLVHTMQDPAATTTDTDLGLMDISAGHFAQLAYILGTKNPVGLPRESANLASKTVRRKRIELDGARNQFRGPTSTILRGQ